MGRSNEEIRNDILLEFKKDPSLGNRDIKVAVENGIVELSGRVENQTQQEQAELLARKVSGVKGVVQEIDITSQTASAAEDETIAQLACQALDSDLKFKHDQVKVVVSGSWIALVGEVDWEHEKEEVESVLKKVPGVKGIANNITVRNPTTANELRSKIIDAFKAGAEHRARQINIQIKDGKVILTGEVRTYIEIGIAEAACKVAGITQVENRLRPVYMLEKRVFEEEQKLRNISKNAQD